MTGPTPPTERIWSEIGAPRGESKESNESDVDRHLVIDVDMVMGTRRVGDRVLVHDVGVAPSTDVCYGGLAA